MKNKFKNIILFGTAVIFIGLGFFNTKQQTNKMAYQNNAEKTGDVQLVSSNNVEEVKVAEEENDYFTNSKLEREIMFSQTIETYQRMIDSPEIPNDQKGIAVAQISKIANYKNGIAISENLIKNKGFNDVVIFENLDKVNIVIKSKVSLTKEQVAQIQNIVTRELGTKIEDLNISIKDY